MFDWKKYEFKFLEEEALVLEWMNSEFNKIRVGRANPAILDNIVVEAYDDKMKINQIANISIPESKVLVIKPYDRSLVKNIGIAITNANIGINPQIDSDLVRLTFPAPTEESRKECTKKTKAIAEEAKVRIRKNRLKLQDLFKNEAENNLDDDKKYFQTQLDEITRQANKKIDSALEVRNKEIMTI